MAWQLARPTEIDDITSFLSTDEWKHVNFTSRLYERSRIAFPHPHRIGIYLNRTSEDHELREAILVSRGGLVLPVLSASSPETNRPDIGTLINNGRRSLHSVMGCKRDVELVVSSVGQRMKTTIFYDLLVLESAGKAKSDHPREELKFRRARPKDLLPLFPLQKAYEKEEVLLDPRRFNATATYMNLQQHLKRELIYYALSGREIVAKAGTNARGGKYDQIGGVYTIESFRNRGVATALMYVLLEHLEREDRGVCLFVKKDNPAALRLYAKLGFQKRDEFVIGYFGQ